MMGWMAPLRHLSAKLLSDRNSSEWEPSMGEDFKPKHCLPRVHRERRERPRGRRRTRLEQRYRRPQSHLANLRLAQAFPNVRERTTGDAAQVMMRHCERERRK